MAEPHLDNHEDIRWFPRHGPAPVLGPCPHDCRHEMQRVIAWGTDMKHYELIQCDADCAGECRSWTNGTGRSTTEWLHVAAQPPDLLAALQASIDRRTAQTPTEEEKP